MDFWMLLAIHVPAFMLMVTTWKESILKPDVPLLQQE